AYLLKTDAEGNQLWDIIIGSTQDYIAKDIALDSEGRICVVVDYVTDGNTTNIRLIRISDDTSSASKLDSVSVGVSGVNDNARSITVISDGSYIVAGSRYPDFLDNPFEGNDVKIASWRFTSQLQPFETAAWNFNVSGFSDYSEVIAIHEGTVRPFYAFGSTNTQNLSGVVNSNPVTANFYAGSVENLGDVGAPIGRGNTNQQNYLVAARKIPGQRYLLLGTSSSASIANRFEAEGDLYFAVVKEEPNNPFLEFEFPKDLNLGGNNLIPRDIAGTQTGNVLVCADVNTPDRGTNILIVKLTADGSRVWSRILNAAGNYKSSRVMELPDGRILVLGTAGLINQRKILLMKLNANGEFLP
ncbi:MAG TPA: hypothetical protein PKC24_16340, partial [Cyclobacteriaceae bacterium]|nr:hypothetical protein [Cyclobacteriaceae bacterium]